MEKPPSNQTELMTRCKTLNGLSIGQLSEMFQQPIPTTLHQAKGWIGTLIERYLGADSFNKSQPDFSHLGIELKTIPLNAHYQPQESTYVCTASLTPTLETWETSRVRNKLAHVLWVPIEATKTIPIPERKILDPILWRLTSDMEEILKQDWEELTEMLELGQVHHLSAKHGVYLQIRPKAAHSRILTRIVDEHGNASKTGPKGFYLRTAFTKQILKK